ncbi:MAG: hypothetical protein U0744_13820 [Gemmataceae bacterium]
MRRYLFCWSVGLLGGFFSVGCTHQECQRCGQTAPRNQVVASKTERPAIRTVKMPARPRHANSAGEEVIVLGEEHSQATGPSPNASLSTNAGATTNAGTALFPIPIISTPPGTPLEDGSPNLPPIRLPFDTSKQSTPTNPSNQPNLPPIIDQIGAIQAPNEVVRNGMTIPGSPDVPISTAAMSVQNVPVIDRTTVSANAATPSGDGVIELTNANVKLGAANDYKALTGHVTSFRKSWRLRYAAVESEDVHGGSVVLNGAGLDRLKDGQLIRVQGSIIPPTDRNQPATFQVQAIEILATGN